MKENRKLSDALWGDLETDEERVNFLIAGRGFETGIIAKAIQHEVAMAFRFRSEIIKERMENRPDTMGLPTRRLKMVTFTDRKSIMNEWDKWREYIANGGKGSWPSDGFESLLDHLDEVIEKAKATTED